jgi:hypothetical protein
MECDVSCPLKTAEAMPILALGKTIKQYAETCYI